MTSAIRSQIRSAVVSGSWLALLIGLLEHGAGLLPLAIARHLSGESYSILVQTFVSVTGVVLYFLLLDDPRQELGLKGLTEGRGVLLACLLAPAAYVGICYAAVGLALPTLKQELARGGVALVRSQGGAIIGAMTRPTVAVPLLWAVLISPVGEELLFRGAIWGAMQRWFVGAGAKPTEFLDDERVPLERSIAIDVLVWSARSGTITTLVTAALFAFLHADLPGSQGVVRVSSAAGLALVCGVARQASGTLAAPVVLHVLINAFTFASARRWIVTDAFPKFYTVPTLASLLAVLGLAAAAGLMQLRRMRRAASRPA